MYVGKDDCRKKGSFNCFPETEDGRWLTYTCSLLLSHWHIHDDLSPSLTCSTPTLVCHLSPVLIVIIHITSMLVLVNEIKFKRLQLGAQLWTPGDIWVGYACSFSILSLSAHSWIGGGMKKGTDSRDSSMAIAHHTGCYQSRGDLGFPSPRKETSVDIKILE